MHNSINRERILERVVHAKGAGAHGYFEVTQYVLTNKPYPYSNWVIDFYEYVIL